METQQILLIVLSVIIVGVAIFVGITMFRNQAFDSNQKAIASEAQNYASKIIQWWKTSVSDGGAGQAATADDVAAISTFIGFAADGTYTSESGTFTIDSADGTTVVITAVGKEVRGEEMPGTTTTITLATGDIVTDESPVAVEED